MGVFDDKKFEQLDWMTQITETIDSELNRLLARLPNETVLDMDLLLTMLTGYKELSLDLGSAVGYLIAKHCGERVSYEDSNKIVECFEFEVSDEVELNFVTREMKGEIRLIKKVAQFEDEVLQGIMGHKGLEVLRRINVSSANPLSRMNEVLELLDMSNADRAGRSMRKKMNSIITRLTNIFKTNEWRIRDTELADKICFWIKDYVETGNLAAFTNFCKIKVMTHSNMPIYSIEEEV